MLASSRPADGVASSFPGDAGPRSGPHDARMADVHSAQRELGGFTPRAHPAFGMRPALRFALAVTLTVAYLVFAVSVSHVWRGELEAAIGPVMAWVIPISDGVHPGARDRLHVLHAGVHPLPPAVPGPPAGPWPPGEWPAITVIIAA